MLTLALVTPLVLVRVSVARVEPPSSKVTVPVGVKEPAGTTVAVKVMLCPLTEGLLLEVSGVLVTACTFCVNADEALPRFTVSPLNTALMECEPFVRLLITRTACNEPSRVPAPSTVVPSRNVTVPLGDPVPDVETVAVKVTEVPVNDGLLLETTVVAVVS